MIGCPGYRTRSFQYQLSSLGSIQPCCHFLKGLVTVQTRKQSLSYQVPIHSWVERVHIQLKCLAQGHSAHRRSRDPYRRPLSPKSQAILTAPRRPACMWSIYILECRDTESGHCQGAAPLPQWFFHVPLQVSEMVPPLRDHASHGRYTVSNVKGRELNFRNFCPSRNRTPNRRLGGRTPLPARLLRHFSTSWAKKPPLPLVCTMSYGFAQTVHEVMQTVCLNVAKSL